MTPCSNSKSTANNNAREYNFLEIHKRPRESVQKWTVQWGESGRLCESRRPVHNKTCRRNWTIDRLKVDGRKISKWKEYSYPKTVHFQSFSPLNPSGPSAVTLQLEDRPFEWKIDATIMRVHRSLTLESIHKPLQGHLIIELVRTSMSNKYLKYFKPTYGTDYSFSGSYFIPKYRLWIFAQNLSTSVLFVSIECTPECTWKCYNPKSCLRRIFSIKLRPYLSLRFGMS